MSQSSKSAYYNALKDEGAPLEKHYRDYTTDELAKLAVAYGIEVVLPATEPPPAARSNEVAEIREELKGVTDLVGKLAELILADKRQPAPPPPVQQEAPKPEPKLPAQGLDPSVHAGVTLNTHTEDEPIKVDENGVAWYQIEVQKPGYAKPRGRRVLRSMDAGVVQQTITTSDGYTETFEIPGDPAHKQQTETKVTLPSFQTGIFKAPGMPFKIHIYQGNRGFDWEDVNKYYGGPDLVPDTVKRTYVSSDLCYDLTTTIRAIQDEYRERVLKKEAIR